MRFVVLNLDHTLGEANGHLRAYYIVFVWFSLCGIIGGDCVALIGPYQSQTAWLRWRNIQALKMP